MRRSTGLILAMDLKDEEKALGLAGTLGDRLDFIKVNYPLVLACGMGIVEGLSRSAPVICDFKVADIPNTNRLIVEEVFRRGAQGVIVHGFAGSDSVKECVRVAGEGHVFVVVEMSHPGGLEFTRPVSDRLAALAVEAKAAGIIAPATRPERVAHYRSLVGDLKILATGVGAQGGSAADVIRAGADYVIVGRSIYESRDPAGEADRLVEEIRGAL